MSSRLSDLSVSVIIPVYNDEKTLRTVVKRTIKAFEDSVGALEIVIVEDGSPDRVGEIADELHKQRPDIFQVEHHPENRGYGAALRTGVSVSRHDWICMVDGDDEYDVTDMKKMLELRDYYPLIIAFRYKKLYSGYRIFISFVYNLVLRFLYRTPFRDVSTGLRVFHRSILDDIELDSDSPFVGAELAIKAMLRGYPVGQVGIQTFPRRFGQGSSTSVKNIIHTISDMLRTRRQVFSDRYHMPPGRMRNQTRKDERSG